MIMKQLIPLVSLIYLAGVNPGHYHSEFNQSVVLIGGILIRNVASQQEGVGSG